MNFPFYDYEYYLDVTKQHEIMPDDIDMAKGLKEAADWYMHNQNAITKKPYKGKYKGKAKKYIDIRGQEARKYWKVREIHE